MSHHRVAVPVVCALFILAGCGPTPIKVKGKLVGPDGKAITVSAKGKIEMIFEPEKDGEGSAYPTTIEPDGTFEVVGNDNKGIVPGKYKVKLRVLDPYVPGDPKATDVLKNKNLRIYDERTGKFKEDNRIPVEITGPTDNLEIKARGG